MKENSVLFFFFNFFLNFIGQGGQWARPEYSPCVGCACFIDVNFPTWTQLASQSWKRVFLKYARNTHGSF